VLADIAAATDRPDEASFFRDVVEAIRISEKADAFFNAGLLARATGLYNQALEKFADAYCIQSRLARQYSELGQDDLAEQHYRRAFELMPSSFGRMESHCFGCEGAFSGPRAQATAEDVFGKLLASDPQNPKVHYLMGYLRSAQGNYPEAAERYREAVALDPLYINAWKNLLSTGERIHLPVEDRDKAKLAILKLDPLGRHSYSRDVDVRDLQQLWQISEDNSKLVPEKPTALLKLAAATNVEPNGHEDEVMQRIYSRLGRNEAATGGGAAVRSHKAVTMLVALVDGMP
jgi:tetratricopeptide (TPR) repeat protein